MRREEEEVWSWERKYVQSGNFKLGTGIMLGIFKRYEVESRKFVAY